MVSLLTLYFVNFLLTPQFRIWGVGIGLIASIVVMVGMGYYYTNKYYRIDFEWTKNLITITFGCVLSFATVNVRLMESDWLNAVLLLVLVNIIFLVFAFMITANEDKIKAGLFVSSLLKNKSSI